NRATVHLKFRQYQAALEDTNQALAHCQPAIRLLAPRGGDYPYAAHVYAQRALAYGGLRNYQAALENARKAVDLAPVYGPNFFSLGQIYLATNALAQARQAFQQGFDADSKDVSNAVLLAWTRMCDTLSFNVEEAFFLSEAAQNYPESEWGHLSLGMAAWLREDYDTSLAYLSQARQRDVMNPHCYFWLGMCHASREEDDLARSALQQAAQSGLASLLFLPAKYFEMKKSAFYQFTLYFR
ncbi:MAG: tetratricopeptide repeat protein, partial [Ktedonobacteraceae bacterium]